MKLYRAKLYKLDKDVPYVENKTIFAEYDWVHKNMDYRDTYIDLQNDKYVRETKDSRIFKPVECEDIYVKKRINGLFEEITTCHVFPQIKICNYEIKSWSGYDLLYKNKKLNEAYFLSKPFNRAYIEIIESISIEELKELSDSLKRTNIINQLYRQNTIEQIIEKESVKKIGGRK